MRLKELKLKGFKSFANDTSIHFNENVTGIVGPNGSGKSNIVDAIRWVLGEQKNKELRLESMGDVIFNGTKTRKEAPSASVELIFENDKGIIATEFQTVNISRTVFRSGESEYRLNGVVCRLKDIKSLLLDTGIGSNSYAIISLGMVDDLLYDKDHARRNMFEQAAGVSKYKSRKKETMLKLQSTTADLERVSDLLFEIDGNMKSLEKQAKRTKKYFELKEDYKNFAIQNALRTIINLKDSYKHLSDDITKKQDDHGKINAEVLKKEAELQDKKKNQLEHEIHVSQQQKELNELVAKIRNLENDKNLLIQKINFKQQSIKSIDTQLNDNNVLIQQLKVESEKLSITLAEQTETEKVLAEKLADSLEKLNTVKNKQFTIKTDYDSKLQKIQNLQKESFEIDKDIAVTQNNISSFKSEIGRAEEEINITKEDKEEFAFNLEQSTSTFDLKHKELSNLKDREENRKQTITSLESQRDQLSDELNKINRSLDAKQNELDLLKSMIENFEGFPESHKFLSTNWRKDVPVLSDLLDVQEEYKSSIEQYLEPYLTYFVVNDLGEATEALKLLSGAQKGKANFFLLNKIPQAETVNINIPFATPALNFIKTEGKYQHLLSYLLQNAYIFDGNVDDVRNTEDHDNINFLSKSGVFLKTRFTLSGGSIGLFEGKKIGRKKNVEKLEEEITNALTQKQSLYSKLEGLKQELLQYKSSDKTMEVELLSSELAKIEQEKTRLNVSLENLVNKIQSNEEKIRKCNVNIAEAKEKLEGLEVEKAQHRRQIDEEENTLNTSNNDLESITNAMNIASQEYNASNIEYIRQQNYISNLQKDLDFKNSRLSELESRTQTETNKKDSDQQELVDAENQKINIENDLITIYQNKNEFQSKLNDVEKTYFESKNVITTLDEEIRILNRSFNQYQSEINTLKDSYQEIKFQINAIADRIHIEFNITLDEMMKIMIDETLNDEELATKTETMRNRIANYGEINPLAMEAYDEIKVRFDVITTQRNDILEAKESLMLTITEIENTATSQYMQAFTEIRSNFINVFRSLFTEDDNCDLILVDPSNPLDSDIEIVAKPKGKKPKSLSQLSGGEKTLTATALLFSLYLLKPAPFCIFDEVDAPLDDANIQKFNKIIKKFSENSQFIIITHNKSTMTAVDVLYGVYMQEMGVSGLTPVDFRNFKEEGAMYEEISAN